MEMYKRDQISGYIKGTMGLETGILDIQPVSGGDINKAFLILLEDGRRIFLKENDEKNAGFFEAEKAGLAALRETAAIGVPEVYGSGVAEGRAYLLMEYLDAAPKKPDYWECLGRQLATMHRSDTAAFTPGGRYGFPENNYIGAGIQINTVCDSWAAFFRDYRLEVQFRRALSYFDAADRKTMQILLDHLEEYLIEPEYPSLLHGDLWGGNFVTGPDGHAWLIDPAVYVGHSETDLAMTELFGGFAPAFYDSYREAAGIEPGYADRREIYNLYHLLNHLNLFGESYYGAVMQTVRRFSRM